MEYDKAIIIAEKVKELLEPHCMRCEIAGSIRCKKIWVNDIEIVAIPKPYDHGVFSDGLGAVVNNWEKVRGKMIYGIVKYTQRKLPAGIVGDSESIMLDLFFTGPENWGRTFASRTGPESFSKELMIGLLKKDYKSVNNHLYKNGARIDVPEEEDLFRLIGIPFVKPEHRS